jgi:hypothetical protein
MRRREGWWWKEDFFRAFSDISGRRYGSGGWCSMGPRSVDGNACLLRKQKRRFCFIFPEIEEKILSELALSPIYIFKEKLDLQRPQNQVFLMRSSLSFWL